MKTVDIFAGINGIKDCHSIQPFRQRKLYQNAIHLGIGIEGLHLGQDLFPSAVCGQVDLLMPKAHPGGDNPFSLHIDLARWILADKDDCKPGLPRQRGCSTLHTPLVEALGQFTTAQYRCHAGVSIRGGGATGGATRLEPVVILVPAPSLEVE